VARFVVADITNTRSIRRELIATIPNLPSVPVQPLLLVLAEGRAEDVDLMAAHTPPFKIVALDGRSRSVGLSQRIYLSGS